MWDQRRLVMGDENLSHLPADEKPDGSGRGGRMEWGRVILGK